jgi:hypothetical protein
MDVGSRNLFKDKSDVRNFKPSSKQTLTKKAESFTLKEEGLCTKWDKTIECIDV